MTFWVKQMREVNLKIPQGFKISPAPGPHSPYKNTGTCKHHCHHQRQRFTVDPHLDCDLITQ